MAASVPGSSVISRTTNWYRRKPSSAGFQDDPGERNLRARTSPHLRGEFFNFASSLLFVGLSSVGRLNDPEGMAIVRNLHRFARARHALDLERFADQGAERTRLHAVRQ